MKVHCPDCRALISIDDINIKENVAVCRTCRSIHSASALSEHVSGFDFSRPPPGAWYRDEGHQVVAGATTRGAAAFFLVPFMLVWCSFAFGGLYGSQITHGRFDLSRTLFGIPFLIIGSAFLWQALMHVFGHVEVRLSNGFINTFTGIGPIGRTRTIALDDVAEVLIEHRPGPKGSSTSWIVLAGVRQVSFGCHLNDERREFIADVLRAELAGRARSTSRA